MIEQVVREAVARLKAGAEAYFPGRTLRSLEPGAVRTRPFSYLAWVRVDFLGSSQRLVIKIPRLPLEASPEKARKLLENLRREYDTPRVVNGLLARESSAMRAVAPVAFFDDLPALVMEEAPGEVLSDLVARRARWYPSRDTVADLGARCAEVGRWLRLFQSVTTRPAERLSLDDMRRYVESRLDQLVDLRAVGADRHWKAALLRYFDAVAGQVAEADRSLTGVHGDFSLSNVLSSGRQTVVLDFSQFTHGSRFHDVTRFWHQLGLLLNKPCFRPATIERLRRAFLSGWDERFDTSAPLFRLFMLRHQVCHWVGLMKEARGRMHSRLYNRWTCVVHLREIRRLISERS